MPAQPKPSAADTACQQGSANTTSAPECLQYRKGLYPPTVPLALVELIETELAYGFHYQRKLTIQYGNPVTGKAWVDKPVTGFLSVIDGPQLVLKKNQSRKAHDVVLLGNIVRVETPSRVLYRHPTYHTHAEAQPEITEQNTDRALRRISIGRHGSTSSEQHGEAGEAAL